MRSMTIPGTTVNASSASHSLQKVTGSGEEKACHPCSSIASRVSDYGANVFTDHRSIASQPMAPDSACGSSASDRAARATIAV
jgi:hypothetical protein